MAFQKFTESGRGYRPKISVRSSGNIGLNAAAVKKFELENAEAVCLLFDPDSKSIAITRATKEEEGAHHLHKGVTGASISAKRFLDYWDINAESTQAFECRFDRDSGMIILDRPIRKRERRKAEPETA